MYQVGGNQSAESLKNMFLSVKVLLTLYLTISNIFSILLMIPDIFVSGLILAELISSLFCSQVTYQLKILLLYVLF